MSEEGIPPADDSVRLHDLDIERKIVELVAGGSAAELQETYSRLVGPLEERPPSSYKSAALHVLLVAASAFDRFERGRGLAGKIDFDEAISKLASCETRVEADGMIRDLFERMIAERDAWKSNRDMVLAARISDFIEANHADKNLSGAAVAEHVGLSPDYVGKIYRRVSGSSIGDRIGRCRIAVAKRLLAETDRDIEDIADAAGFGNLNYFYAYFKKATGSTPRQFRNSRS